MIHACRAVLEQQTQLLLFCCTHYQLLKRGEFTKKRDELHIFVLEAVIWKYSKLISFFHVWILVRLISDLFVKGWCKTIRLPLNTAL